MRSVSTRFVGLLLVALGAWGGLVPFVGHYFHFALGPDKSWDWTTARLYLDVLPGVATVLGGLILMGAGPRGSARLGALLALAGGIWFAIGPEISQLRHAGGAQGAGHGSAHRQMLEMLTYHTGLGVVIAALAAYALPRFPVVDEVAAPARGREGRVAAAGTGAAAGAAAARGNHWYREPAAADVPASRREPVAAAEEPGTRPHSVADRGATVDRPVPDRRVGAEGAVAADGPVAAGAPVADRGGVTDQPGLGEPAGAGAVERDRAMGEEPTSVQAATEPADTPAAGAAQDRAGTGAPVAEETAPAPTRTRAEYVGHPGVRRRRGGLLG